MGVSYSLSKEFGVLRIPKGLSGWACVGLWRVIIQADRLTVLLRTWMLWRRSLLVRLFYVSLLI